MVTLATPTTSAGTPSRYGRWRRLLAVLALVALALGVLVLAFPWDLLRGPISRAVSERTGRHFEITRKLDVRLGRIVRVRAEGIVFGNPSWAQVPNMLQADSAEVQLRLWPLLHGRIEMPEVVLHKPQLGLELMPDGRRSWDLGRDGKGQPLQLDTLVVDQGSLRFVAPGQRADIRADFGIDAVIAGSAVPAGAAAQQPGSGLQVLPLNFRAGGTWRGENFVAEGRTGNVLTLRGAQERQPFPVQLALSAGSTSLQASGSVASLATLEGAQLQVRLAGRDLAELYPLAGLVLPQTPPYQLAGRVSGQSPRWRLTGLQGRLGRSDVTGDLELDHSQAVPRLSGALRSQLLDFDDLAPVIGMAPPRRNEAQAATAAQQRQRQRQRRVTQGRVLPDVPLDVQRLARMNADVRFSATRVVNAHGLPLDSASTHVRLDAGVLRLEPLEVGYAGGRLAGRLRIDGSRQPTSAQLLLDGRGLKLDKLFPRVELTQASVGELQAHLELNGRGRSVAAMLATADGEATLLMGPGRISNLLMELAGLDGGEIIKFLAGRDQQVQLRCAAAGFDVQGGLMRSRVLVLDTADTVIWGDGSINLANETLDLVFKPAPKDKSILSLRSPLRLTGTLGAPQAGVDKASLVARAGAAIALGMINPLLGLAATVETGPGRDADCAAVLRQAASKAAGPAQEQARMGGTPAAPTPHSGGRS